MALYGDVWPKSLLDENWDLPWRRRGYVPEVPPPPGPRGPPMDWRTGQVGARLQNQQPRTMPEIVGGAVTGLLGEDGQAQAAKRMLGAASELTALPSAYRVGGDIARSEPGSAILEAAAASALPIKAGALALKGAVAGGKAILPKALATFLGVGAKTAKLDMLAKAQKLEKAGADPNRIRNATGWMRFPDNEWRFEISDQPAKYTPGKEEDPFRDLGTALHHPELYKAHPELAKVRLETTPGEGGYYSPAPKGGTSLIGIGEQARDPRSTALHEVQHGLQHISNFASGGNPQAVKLTRGTPGGRVYQEILKTYGQPVSLAEYAKVSGHGDISQMSPGQLAALASDYKNYTAYAKKAVRQPGSAANVKARDAARLEAYRRLAGETEARLVQKRKDYTPEETRARNPLAEFDVPPEKQIVRRPGEQETRGLQLSAPPKGLFDVSGLEKVPKVPQRDLPRYEPPRGVPQRILDLTGNKKVRDKMLKIIQGGVEKGGKRWYNAEPLRHEFVAELGKDEGNQAFRRFMEYVSATSPRSKVPENVRNASYYYMQERQGKLPKIGAKNPPPYGHLAQKLHQMNAQRVKAGGIDPLNNPKPPSFSENLSGNQKPATVDAHAFKLPAILSGDPRFLSTAFKPEKGAASQNIRAGVEKGLLDLKKDVRPVHYESQPKETEYKAMERYYKGLADELGITPAQAQSSAWQAGGKITGLGSSETEAFIETMQDRIMRTARAFNMNPRDVLKKMIRGEMSLLGIGALGGLLAAGGHQDAAPEGT